MDRKIVEMLMQGASVKVIARSLHVGRSRVRRLRELAQEHGYLALEGRGAGPSALPPFPEAIFPDPSDGRSVKMSEEHLRLEAIRDWIWDRLEVGWQPITVFEELPEPCRGVSRSSFYRYLERVGLDRAGQHYRRVVPEIIHQPGEALIVDWGKLCDAADPVSGKRRPVWCFVGVLGYSRCRLVRLVWTMDLGTTLRVLEEMLREIGGVPSKVTLDNPRCIAWEASRYEPVLNPVAERFAQHYGFFFECLPPAEPQMKGHVERQIPYVRRLRQSRSGVWEGLEREEEYLKRKVAIANEQRHGTTRRRPREVFADEEATALKALPAVAYAIEQYHEGVVRKDGYVRFDSKYYAAGEGLIGNSVAIIANPRQVALYHEGKLLEIHARLTDPRQMKAAKPHQLKPWERTLQDGAFYLQRAAKIGPQVRAWVEEVLRQGQGFVDTRRVWGVLSLDKRYAPDQIDAACGKALAMGSTSYRLVLRLLEVREALEKGEVERQEAPASPTIKGAAAPKYAKSLTQYQDLLPLWRPSNEGGHA